MFAFFQFLLGIPSAVEEFAAYWKLVLGQLELNFDDTKSLGSALAYQPTAPD
jgi:hypothetical protein